MKKREWEYPVCNICGSEQYQIIHEKLTYWEYEGEFRIVRCSSCSLIYTSPRPNIEETPKYYKQDNYFGRNISDASLKFDDNKEREEAYGSIYSLIFYLKNKGSILDIGAGTGLFLSKFNDLGWKVDGVELLQEAVHYAKKRYGILLRRGDFFDFKFHKNSFDVVVMNGSLEHMHDPLSVVGEIKDLLKKDGIFVFSVPNSDSLGSNIFGRKWFPWQPPRHLYHFSPKTISKLLGLAGFRELRIEYNYWLQNYYILFQSFRYGYSPKFQSNVLSNVQKYSRKRMNEHKSLMIETGKFVASVASHTLSIIEPLFKKGEVMIVYAKK